MRALALVLLAGCTSRPLGVPVDLAPDLTTVDLAGRDLTAFDLATRDLASRDLATRDLVTFDLARVVDFSAPPPPRPCPAGTRFIFTMDTDGTLSRFNPVTRQFFDVGPIVCPSASGDSPNSMAVARTGEAYVNFESGAIFLVQTTNAACSATSWTSQFGITTFGMSFAQNSPTTSAETLWITPQNFEATGSLSSVSVNTFIASQPIPMATTGDGELTGDDEGNLWGFFPNASVPLITRIDKQTAALDRTMYLRPIAGAPAAWGFAAWQSDFYVFLKREGEASTSIYFVDHTTGAVSSAAPSTGRTIVGVGAATCAGDPGD